MATDFAVYYLTQPFGIALQFALFVGPAILLKLVAANSFARLGVRRTVFAQLAVAVAVFAMSAVSAYSIGEDKVQLGHIQSDDLAGWVAGNSIYLFVLTYVFALAFTSLILLPFCVWLLRMNRASITMFLALGIALAFGLALLLALFPSNDWGREHPFGLFASTLSSLGLGILVVCLAFSIGARLPMRSAHSNNAT